MKSELEDRSIAFGIAVIKMLRTNDDGLTKRTREQLVSSATAIGANIAESRSAQSLADFISKLELALKEARETDYWLKILRGLADYETEQMKGLINECDHLTAMLVASVLTSKKKRIGGGDGGGSSESRFEFRGRALSSER